jgi:hypothetical protein
MIFPWHLMALDTKLGRYTFLMHAPVGGDMNVNDFGIDFGWGGLRTTKAIVQQFSDPSAPPIKSQVSICRTNLEINDIGEFRAGTASGSGRIKHQQAPTVPTKHFQILITQCSVC